MEAWKEELYHIGMPRRSGRYPWGSGKRPYQGDDLKRTFGKTFERAGDKKKINARVKRRATANKAFARTEKQGKDKPNVSPVESAIKNTKRIVDDTGGVMKKIDNARNRTKERDLRQKIQVEANSMSNDQLRKLIERMNLEDTYVNKKASRYSNGKNKAIEILDIAGDFTSIGLSVAAIVATIYGLKK